MSSTIVTRFSFPKVPGDTNWSQLDLDGPASYVTVTPGHPPHGGQLVRASDFGMGLQSMTFAWSMGSTDGRYSVVIFPLGFERGNSFTEFLVMWKTADDGAEVTAGHNLSGSQIRLKGLGA